MTGEAVVSFRLYVAGEGQNSARAIANLTSLCHDRLAGRHQIEIVDVFDHPDRALADAIVMTPTLMRLEPTPVLRVIGTLQPVSGVIAALGLVSAEG